MQEEPFAPEEGILHYGEGVDLMPGNIELSAMEVSLVNSMSRETVLRSYINTVKNRYKFVLIDCMPRPIPLSSGQGHDPSPLCIKAAPENAIIHIA
jgi:cellulose biosynthesis protein BcsQ